MADHIDLWTMCPKCRHKYGIPATIVIKYTDRMLKELSQRIDRSWKQRQQQAPPPKNLPVEE